MLQPFQSQFLTANASHGSPIATSHPSRPPDPASTTDILCPTSAIDAAATTTNNPYSQGNDARLEDRHLAGSYERFHAAMGSVLEPMMSTETGTASMGTAGTTGVVYDPRNGQDSAQRSIPPPPPPPPPAPQVQAELQTLAQPQTIAKPNSPDRDEIAHQSNTDDNNENNNSNNNNNNNNNIYHQPSPELSNAELRRRFNESIHQQNQRSPSFHLGTYVTLTIT